MMILIAYDGSADAQSAIDRAARLFPGAEATVLTVWQEFVNAMIHSGAMGVGMGYAGTSGEDWDVDAVSQKAALAMAGEGAERAAAAGLVAEARIATRYAGMAQAILTAADEVDADVVVLGTRGLSGVKSLLLGSVSHGVVQHADRAVLVVPSAELAEHRRGAAHRLAQPVG